MPLETIPALLRAAAHQRGEAEALVMPGARLTYAELLARVERVAGGLSAVGVGTGTNVAICMANSPEWLIAWYATAWLGAAAVPINTRWKDEEVAWALDFTDVTCVVLADTVAKIDFLATFERLRSRLPKITSYIVVGPRVPAWGVPFNSVAALAPAPAAAPDSVGLIQFTSGSTARPKGAMLSHAAMLMSARGTVDLLGVRPCDRYFSPRPLFHVAGSVSAALVTLASQCCLVSIPIFDAAAALTILAQERCNFTIGNDAMFLMLMNQPDVPPLPHLRGGYAAAGPQVHRLIRDQLGIRYLCSSYGMSETCSAPALTRWDDPFEMRAAGALLPYPGVEIRIRRPGTPIDCAIGEPGELFIRGRIVMTGYYKLPEVTAATIDTDGWLASGDLAIPEPGGRFRFVGRLKDIIRVGGENVSPAEVEGFLLNHPKIAAAQVVGLPDERLGEVVAAYVVLRADATDSPAGIIEWAKAAMAGFKAPRHVGIVRSFDDVMTGSGKPRKDLLRARAKTQFILERSA